MSEAQSDGGAGILGGATTEHEKVLERVGVWDVDCSYYAQPGEPPLQVKAVDTVEALGSFRTIAKFECDILGTPLKGQATWGFDPVRKAYVGTWFDTATPFLYYFEGEFDESGKVLTMEGDNVDPMSRAIVTYRSVEEIASRDERTLSLFVDAPGRPSFQVLEYKYTRRI